MNTLHEATKRQNLIEDLNEMAQNLHVAARACDWREANLIEEAAQLIMMASFYIQTLPK